MAISPYEFIEELSKELTPDDTVIADAGSAYYCCAQALKLPDGARYITDLAQAAMGAAIPMGIGAALAKKTGMVYVITGDGSFMMQAMQTVILDHEKIRNIKIYVLANGGYKVIRDSQDRYCNGRRIGTMEHLRRFTNAAASVDLAAEFIDIDPTVPVRRPNVKS